MLITKEHLKHWHCLCMQVLPPTYFPILPRVSPLTRLMPPVLMPSAGETVICFLHVPFLSCIWPPTIAPFEASVHSPHLRRSSRTVTTCC